MKLQYLVIASLVLFVGLPGSSGGQKRDNSNPFEAYVTKLPSVDKVEIFAIRGTPVDMLGKVDCKKPDVICNLPGKIPAKIAASKVFLNDDAVKVASLWRGLKSGNGAGCIAPAYAMRFYKDDKQLLTAEVCFHCCNMVLPDYGIAAMCGDTKALTAFKEFVTTEVPFPKAAGN